MTKYIGPKTADENVATQADKLSLSSATPDALTPDQAGAAGTATTAARSDHQHEIVAGAAGTILPDDAAAEGASTSFARADHTHAITAAPPSSNLTGSTTNSEGTATSFARSDHSHAITTGAAGTITGTNAEGSSASLARADHNHAIATAAPGTILPDAVAAAGSAASFSRSDHTHAIDAAAPSANLTATSSNSEGSSNSFTRADHSHAISTGSAGTLTGSNATGTSVNLARADHDHAFGSKSVPASALALGPTYETSLPASPVDGQEIYYAADTTNGVIWHLRYRSGSSSSYKWEFIGGSALTAYVDTNEGRSSNTFGDLATVGPSITLPLNGNYEIVFEATFYNDSNANSTGARCRLNINGTTLAETQPYIDHLAVTAFDVDGQGRTTVQEVTGTRVVKMVYNNRAGSGNAQFLQRALSIRPVRVG